MDRFAARAHRIKGAAATLGARAVAQAAGDAEIVCCARDARRAGDAAARLSDALRELRQAAASALRTSEEPAHGEAREGVCGASDDDLAALLEQLRSADLGALERFTELTPELRRRMGIDAHASMRTRMDNLQFAEAAESLAPYVGARVAPQAAAPP